LFRYNSYDYTCNSVIYHCVMGARRIFCKWGNQGVWGTEVPQRGPGAEPRWGSGDEAPEADGIVLNKDTQTLFPVRRHHLQVVSFIAQPLIETRSQGLQNARFRLLAEIENEFRITVF